jgi:hypothetical protein
MAGTFPFSNPGGVGYPFEFEGVTSDFNAKANNAMAYQRQAIRPTGHRWRLSLRSRFLKQADWRKLYAFLVAQEGIFSTFTINSTLFNTPGGTVSGTPLANGLTAAGAMELATDGWSFSQTVLKAGDVFKFANHAKVYMAISDAVSSGAGACNLSFRPALVADVADNTALVVSNVPFTVALAENAHRIEHASVDGQYLSKIEFDMLEVWN